MFRSGLLGTCLLTLSSAAASGAFTLSDGGQSAHVIVIPASPSPSVSRAAHELQHFLAAMTGATCPIVDEHAPVGSRELVLGVPGRLAAMGITPDLSALGPEGYQLKTVGTSLGICGSEIRGVLYGVYGLLEDHLGCRWFTPEVSHIPQTPTLRIPDVDETVIPPLEYRWPAVRDCYDADWCVRNRVNVSPRLGAEHGGSVTFAGWAHTFAGLVPVDRYFDSHPEYFALVKGRRLRELPQLCCTNEEVIRIVTEGIRERMRSNPDATYFSVSQNDWANYCECDTCQALAQREDSQMGPVLHLVNRVADAVATEFPDKRITTLAYQWSRKPPRTLRPSPNVTIRLCSIECCFAHGLAACEYPANVRFRDDIQAWAEICNNLWVWNYTTNFRHYYLPHPALRALDDDIRFFVAHNVKGIYEQDTKLTLNGDLSPLGGYMMAKFLWNPSYDEDTAMNEFLAAVYGPAATPIRAYIDLLHDKVEKDTIHLRCFTTVQDATYLTEEILGQADQLFAQAEAAVQGQADVLRRVQEVRLAVDFAIIERLGRAESAPVTIDHARFTVEPQTFVGLHADRFLRVARDAGVLTMSERRLTLDEYAASLVTLRNRQLSPHDPLPGGGIVPGVVARYYEADAWPRDRNLAGLAPISRAVIPQIDLSGRRRDSMFGFLFDGLFEAPRDGVYTFHLKAESGSELQVAGETIIDGVRASSSRSVSGLVALRQGWHQLRLRFVEYGYNDGLSIEWEGPEQRRTPLAASQLGHIPE